MKADNHPAASTYAPPPFPPSPPSLPSPTMLSTYLQPEDHTAMLDNQARQLHQFRYPLNADDQRIVDHLRTAGHEVHVVAWTLAGDADRTWNTAQQILSSMGEIPRAAVESSAEEVRRSVEEDSKGSDIERGQEDNSQYGVDPNHDLEHDELSYLPIRFDSFFDQWDDNVFAEFPEHFVPESHEYIFSGSNESFSPPLTASSNLTPFSACASPHTDPESTPITAANKPPPTCPYSFNTTSSSLSNTVQRHQQPATAPQTLATDTAPPPTRVRRSKKWMRKQLTSDLNHVAPLHEKRRAAPASPSTRPRRSKKWMRKQLTSDLNHIAPMHETRNGRRRGQTAG